MKPAHRVRAVVNAANLSTPLGLLVGLAGGARFATGPDGLILGDGYRLPVPAARAFTVGNVVLFARIRAADAPAPLLAHESRHASQYAICLGPAMVPLYLVACGWSWVRTGDFASRNIFETRAGLRDGGYTDRPLRPMFRRGGREEQQSNAGSPERTAREHGRRSRGRRHHPTGG
ncbi:MAG: eCIS core domain-containing protein [Actinomycetota bacterium]